MNALKGNVSSPYSLNLAIFIFIFFISVLIGMSVWISTFWKAKSLNLASPFTFLIKRWRGHTIELCFWPHSTPNPVYVVNEWSYSVLVLLFFLLRLVVVFYFCLKGFDWFLVRIFEITMTWSMTSRNKPVTTYCWLKNLFIFREKDLLFTAFSDCGKFKTLQPWIRCSSYLIKQKSTCVWKRKIKKSGFSFNHAVIFWFVWRIEN